MAHNAFENKIVNDLHQANGMQHAFQDLQSLRQHESAKSFHKDLAHLNHTLHKKGLLPKFEVIEDSPSGLALRERGGHHLKPSATASGEGADADPTGGGPHTGRHRRETSERASRNVRGGAIGRDSSLPDSPDSADRGDAPPAVPARRGREGAGPNRSSEPQPDALPNRKAERTRQTAAADDAIPDVDQQLGAPKAGGKNLTGRVAFFGDSITKGMTASPEFKKYFGADVENFGHDSDTTQNLLSRLKSGQDDSKGAQPEKGVILIGTNNLGKGESDHQIAQDVLADVAEASRRNPNTKFLVVGLLPRHKDAGDPYRQHIANINSELSASLSGNSRVKFADIGNGMLEKNGNMSDRLWQAKYNYVHPTFGSGFDRLLNLLKPNIDSL